MLEQEQIPKGMKLMHLPLAFQHHFAARAPRCVPRSCLHRFHSKTPHCERSDTVLNLPELSKFATGHTGFDPVLSSCRQCLHCGLPCRPGDHTRHSPANKWYAFCHWTLGPWTAAHVRARHEYYLKQGLGAAKGGSPGFPICNRISKPERAARYTRPHLHLRGDLSIGPTLPHALTAGVKSRTHRS